MPRTNKAQALYQIETEAENTTCAYTLAPSSEEDDDYEGDFEELLPIGTIPN